MVAAARDSGRLTNGPEITSNDAQNEIKARVGQIAAALSHS